MEPESTCTDLIKKLETKRGVKCVHLNVNGLFCKLEELKLLLNDNKFDIFAITVTHLHNNNNRCLHAVCFSVSSSGIFVA